MTYNHNCKSNNFVETSQPQHLQINPIIYQRHNYMYPDSSIKFLDGGGQRRKEKRIKIQEGGVGQRRRVAMLSVQSKAIN
jgi:hypothetical protein